MPYKDPERRNAHQKAWRAAHPAYMATWYKDHQEEWRAYTASWRETNGIRKHAYDVAYRRNQPLKVQASQAAYQASHPEQHREQQHRRRSRIRGQFVVAVDAQAIYKRDGARCHICGCGVRKVEASLDHLLPISLGGVHAPWNVGLAHLHCNKVRGTTGIAQLRLPILGGLV